MAITHGHPLALSLLLDVRAQGEEPRPRRSTIVPDIVAALVTGFLAGVPSSRHRRRWRSSPTPA